MATSYDRLKPRSQTALRVETLLARYPDLGERELAELIDLFPRVSLLDQGLMTADDSLSGRLADFHRDHGAKFRTSMPGMIAFLAFPAILTIIALWSVLA